MTMNRFALSIVFVAALVAARVALVGSFAGAAFAQAGPAAPAADGTAGSAGAAPAAPAPPAPAPPAPGDSAAPAAPAAPSPASIADARKACVAAMNADPQFEAEIVKTADQKAQLARDNDTIAAHNNALHQIQKNERHVIYAYAGMWIIAAAFVIFLWRRQQGLKTEIAGLRRDLEAAAADAKPGEPRS